jgi:carbamoyltransferase
MGPEEGWEHLTLYRARGSCITPLEIHTCRDWVQKAERGLWRFESLGGMYAAASALIFGNASDAAKVMGLAAYGTARFAPEDFLMIRDGRLHFLGAVHDKLDCAAAQYGTEAMHRDLAASVQRALEGALLHFVRHLRRITGETRLCLAGGVALNCTANERIVRESGFEEHFVVPAADDAGTAIGAAYLGHWYAVAPRPSRQTRYDGHGRAPADGEIKVAVGAVSGVLAEQPADLLGDVTARLKRGEIGAWVEGGAEFGPRALGHRSIIAAPMDKDMKDRINFSVKFRESFRPFAPAALEDQAADWFDFGNGPAESAFMLRAVPFCPHRTPYVPAVVHKDGTGRLQTLTVKDNGRFQTLVARFYQETNVPMLLNTSMNLRDEPIVETAEDAIWTLRGTALDFCVIGDWLVTKSGTERPILDLVPKVIAQGWSLSLPVRNGALGRASDREDAIRVAVTTPWGETEIVLPPRLAPILSAIDGRSDGHSLLARQAAVNPDPLRLTHDLLLLRRMRVLALEAPP